MIRKLGLLLTALACTSVALAPPSSAGAAPRKATVSEIAVRGSNVIVATGEIVETDLNEGNGSTIMSGTCQAAQVGVSPLFVAHADSTGSGNGIDVACYILDVTTGTRYWHGAYHLGMPAHASWTVWELPDDHNFQLCLWAGDSDEGWDEDAPMSCVDVR